MGDMKSAGVVLAFVETRGVVSDVRRTPTQIPVKSNSGIFFGCILQIARVVGMLRCL